ncbi:MAG: YraN family protein [Blautia sp.]|jgi:putative endonuclease
MNKRKVGADYEQKAADYLRSLGYEILRKNYRCQAGEIDLVAKDGDTLVFVEVKYRTSPDTGSALEAVDARKQRVLEKAAVFYLAAECHSMDLSCRFDVVGIDGGKLSHVRDAFRARHFY